MENQNQKIDIKSQVMGSNLRWQKSVPVKIDGSNEAKRSD